MTAPASGGRDLPRMFDDVEVFVMFIGYPRSGHSLVGSLLDAHPEIIVSHEYQLIQQWKTLYGSKNKVAKNTTKYKLFYELFTLSERQALFGMRSTKATPCRKGGYCYHVPGAWQGTFRQRIRVSTLGCFRYVSLFKEGRREGWGARYNLMCFLQLS